MILTRASQAQCCFNLIWLVRRALASMAGGSGVLGREWGMEVARGIV